MPRRPSTCSEGSPTFTAERADGRTDTAALPCGAATLVSVAGLTKTFGTRHAIDDLSLDVAAGEVFGLVGANGGGKTTALRILAGLLASDSGSGTVAGCDLQRDAGAIRGRVGYMAQRLALYAELSVLENLRFRAQVHGLRRPLERARAAARELDLEAHAHVRAGRLSGGYARRLQLAAALVHEPNVVLLDEPTAGLDALARHEVWRRIDRLAANGAAVIVSTHDLAEAERCVRAALLVGGRVVATGTPDEIARGASAHAYLVVAAGDTQRLARDLAAAPGVVATYPQGGALRVVVRDGACDRLPRLAAAIGARAERVAMRLEDAALAYCGSGGGKT